MTEAQSEPSQSYDKEIFVKIVNDFQKRFYNTFHNFVISNVIFNY